MKRSTKIQLGLRLFAATIALFLGNFVLAGVALAFPGWNYSPGKLAIGANDDDEAEELIKQIKTQTEDMLKKKAFLNKEAVDLIVKEAMKGFEGLDADALKTLLSDGEKGIKAILKAQGDAITALKELDGKKVKKTLKDHINEAMPEIEKFLAAKNDGFIDISLKTVANKVAIPMTTASVVDVTAVPDDLVESFSEAQFVAKRRPREYVYDLASITNVGEVEKYKTWLEEGDIEGNFAVVTEGGLKPLVSAELIRNVATAKKAAGKYIVTEEVTKWRKKAYQIIQRIMRQQFLRDKANILETDLTALATAYTASAFDGAVVSPNNFDAIAAVMSQIMALDFMPDMLILNPQDKMLTMMSKGDDGHYFVNVPMIDPQGNASILGLTVRISNKLDVGEFIVGESGLWEIEQEGIQIRIGYGVTVTGSSPVTSVVSDFDNNQFRVIVEQYFVNYLASPNEGSFVIADFDTVKAAIELVEP